MAVSADDYAAAVTRRIETPVFGLFEQHALARPEAVAVIDRSGATTYAQLHRRALAIGARIAGETAPDEPVVIALPTGADCVAAIMGALAAGRPYVPIDPSHPPLRQAHIVRHSGAKAICGMPQHAAALRPLLGLDHGEEPALVDIADAHGESDSDGSWTPEGTPDSNAYVFYTSGSTGEPKGVFQNQRGLAHDVLQYGEYVALTPGDVLSGLYSPSVVGSLRDIHAALIYGASVVLVDLRGDGAPAAQAALARNRVSVLHAMPPVFRLLFGAGATLLPELRLVYLAGDRLFSGDLTAIRRLAPDGCAIYTGIGSTECTTLYRHWFVPPDWPADGGLLPVGSPIPDRTVEILRPDGTAAAPGEIGEIAVTSRFIALGYWRDPERSAQSFETSPDDPRLRRFRLGDLGRIRPGGLLEFHGRADRQVKIRGSLADPGEIESRLRELDGVTDAAIVVKGRDSPAPELIAFIEGTEHVTAEGCRKALAARLPTQLVPSRFLLLGHLPRLANLKVDYAQLLSHPEVSASPGAQPAPEPPPLRPGAQADTRRIVAEEFRRALGAPDADETALFQELGGDSLKQLELHLALEARLERTLPSLLFDEDFSIASLAAAIAALPPPRMPPGRRTRYVLFPSLRGPGEEEFMLRDAIEEAGRVTMIVYPREMRREIEPNITELVDAMEETGPVPANEDMPTVFIGFSFGARVAYESAARLAAGGRAPPLVLIDTPLWRAFPGIVRARRYLGMIRHWARDNARTHSPQARQASSQAAPPPRQTLATRLSNFMVHRRWKPAADFTAPTLVIACEDMRRLRPELRPDLGWAELCRTVAVREFSGGHTDLCRMPHVAEVADAIACFANTALPAAPLPDSGGN